MLMPSVVRRGLVAGFTHIIKSIARSFRFFSYEFPISVRIRTQRMGEYACAVLRGIGDVVDGGTTVRIHPKKVSHSLRDLMIGAGRIAADPQTANNVSVLVQPDAPTEKYQSARNLTESSALAGRGSKSAGVKKVGLTKAPKRMAWLRKRV